MEPPAHEPNKANDNIPLQYAHNSGAFWHTATVRPFVNQMDMKSKKTREQQTTNNIFPQIIKQHKFKAVQHHG